MGGMTERLALADRKSVDDDVHQSSGKSQMDMSTAVQPCGNTLVCFTYSLQHLQSFSALMLLQLDESNGIRHLQLLFTGL